MSILLIGPMLAAKIIGAAGILAVAGGIAR
jgi:hypothetical protein